MSSAQVVLTKNSDKRPDCPTHPGIRAVYLCETCNDSLACGECVVSHHQGHKMVKAVDFLTLKKESLQNAIRKMKDDIIPTMKANLTLADDRKTKKVQEHNTEVAAIRLKSKNLKEEIDKQTEQLIKECGELHNENIRRLDKYTSNCQDNLSKCNEKLDKLETMLPTLSLGVVTNGKSLNFHDQKFEDECRTQVPECMEMFFMPGEKPIVKMDHIGKIFSKELASHQITRDLTEICSFTHTSSITLLHSTADNKIWTSYSENKDVQLLNQAGNISSTVKTKLTVDCCCVAPSTGNVWMCNAIDQSVYEIPSGRPPQLRFKFAVGMPLSICILQDYTVLLGGVHCIKAFSPTGSAIFSTEYPRKNDGVFGRMMKMFTNEEEESRGRVVVWPRSIRQCSGSGDIAVSDWDSTSHSGSGKPQVIVFNRDLELKFRFYCSEISQPETSDFMPFDACFDNMNDLLVADYGNNSIHLVSGHNGCLLKTLLYTELRPKSLSLSNNILWVALENRNIKVFKYSS